MIEQWMAKTGLVLVALAVGVWWLNRKLNEILDAVAAITGGLTPTELAALKTKYSALRDRLHGLGEDENPKPK